MNRTDHNILAKISRLSWRKSKYYTLSWLWLIPTAFFTLLTILGIVAIFFSVNDVSLIGLIMLAVITLSHHIIRLLIREKCQETKEQISELYKTNI